MNSTQNWVEALKINPEKLSVWSAQAPSGMPLLVWCLEKGHVSQADYLAWASQAYGLPVLANEFFTDATFEIKIFNEELTDGTSIHFI